MAFPLLDWGLNTHISSTQNSQLLPLCDIWFIFKKHIELKLDSLHSNNAICSNMDGPRDYHTKWIKLDRERQVPHNIAYMWNLKYDTNELIYKTEIVSQT